MDICDNVRVSDLAHSVAVSNMPEDDKKTLTELISRIDLFIQSLIVQLRSSPTIYTVDPATHTDVVAGAKPGDIAVYLNSQGDVEISRF